MFIKFHLNDKKLLGVFKIHYRFVYPNKNDETWRIVRARTLGVPFVETDSKVSLSRRNHNKTPIFAKIILKALLCRAMSLLGFYNFKP